MHRWTAKFLLLAMFAPICGPLALARTARLEASHCMRRPLQQTAEPVQSAMPCHHGMVEAPSPASPETSFNAVDACCQNHDCCRSLKTSEWARPAANRFSFVSLSIESALPTLATTRVSSDLARQLSTRAPPSS